jgi:hypothetical protein
MAQELQARRVAAVALALGHLNVSESPRYGGRAIAALATDPLVLTKSGQVLTAGGLTREYGFTDLDGSQPDVWRFIEEIRERGLDASYDDYR